MKQSAQISSYEIHFKWAENVDTMFVWPSTVSYCPECIEEDLPYGRMWGQVKKSLSSFGICKLIFSKLNLYFNSCFAGLFQNWFNQPVNQKGFIKAFPCKALFIKKIYKQIASFRFECYTGRMNPWSQGFLEEEAGWLRAPLSTTKWPSWLSPFLCLNLSPTLRIPDLHFSAWFSPLTSWHLFSLIHLSQTLGSTWLYLVNLFLGLFQLMAQAPTGISNMEISKEKVVFTLY